jgi:hypothetical protein
VRFPAQITYFQLVATTARWKIKSSKNEQFRSFNSTQDTIYDKSTTLNTHPTNSKSTRINYPYPTRCPSPTITIPSTSTSCNHHQHARYS